MVSFVCFLGQGSGRGHSESHCCYKFFSAFFFISWPYGWGRGPPYLFKEQHTVTRAFRTASTPTDLEITPWNPNEISQDCHSYPGSNWIRTDITMVVLGSQHKECLFGKPSALPSPLFSIQSMKIQWKEKRSKTSEPSTQAS